MLQNALQIGSGGPRPLVTIFTQVLYHQPHIVGEANHRLRVTEPKTLRKSAHEIRRALCHFR